MSGHSPFPWRVRVTDMTTGHQVAVLDRNGGVVALCKHAGGQKDGNAETIVQAMSLLSRVAGEMQPGDIISSSLLGDIKSLVAGKPINVFEEE